jgi:hypothetical protein
VLKFDQEDGRVRLQNFVINNLSIVLEILAEPHEKEL